MRVRHTADLLLSLFGLEQRHKEKLADLTVKSGAKRFYITQPLTFFFLICNESYEIFGGAQVPEGCEPSAWWTLNQTVYFNTRIMKKLVQIEKYLMFAWLIIISLSLITTFYI